MLLPLHEANLLVSLLGLPVDQDPYAQLTELRIRRGSVRATTLLDFFSVADDPEIDAKQTDALSHVPQRMHYSRISG